MNANGLLAKSMANASVVTLAGAAHFMISTHPQEVARAIARHVADVGRGAERSHAALSLSQ